ncbi:MAG: hypothetical protein HKL80_11210 [Acidimicrobiales bacterium]|nr:hypothetical protein [Acidimicrobiales bacterium]
MKAPLVIQSHLDKFDRKVDDKVYRVLAPDEYLQGAIALTNRGDAAKKAVGKTVGAAIVISTFSPWINGFANLGIDPDFRGVNLGSQNPVMVATNKRIFVAWNAVEISRTLAITDEVPRNTFISLDPHRPITLGSSKYYLKMGQKKKIDWINALARSNSSILSY